MSCVTLHLRLHSRYIVPNYSSQKCTERQITVKLTEVVRFTKQV